MPGTRSSAPLVITVVPKGITSFYSVFDADNLKGCGRNTMGDEDRPVPLGEG
jgi:hypothetical protein